MRRTGLLLAATALLMVALAGAALAAVIDGDGRANRLVGTERADTIRGLGGDDAVYGRGGDDTLSGNSGNDTVFGKEGADTIHGGTGDDTVYGGDGGDTLELRDGVAGNDRARCGNGGDVARVDSRGEALFGITPVLSGGPEEHRFCETVEYRAGATGVLEPGSELTLPSDRSTHYITDERTGTRYALMSESENLYAYNGRRVAVSGPVTEKDPPECCGGNRRLMDVERIGISELEPAGR